MKEDGKIWVFCDEAYSEEWWKMLTQALHCLFVKVTTKPSVRLRVDWVVLVFYPSQTQSNMIDLF